MSSTLRFVSCSVLHESFRSQHRAWQRVAMRDSHIWPGGPRMAEIERENTKKVLKVYQTATRIHQKYTKQYIKHIRTTYKKIHSAFLQIHPETMSKKISV